MSPALLHALRFLVRGLLALLFVGSGVLHLVRPAFYERIVPPGFPSPPWLVLISGVAEIVGGLGILIPRIPRLRRAIGWGLIALLIAVFPANLYMAMDAERFADLHLVSWILWARLPLQAALIALVWFAALKSEPQSTQRAH